ncbi:type I 3-dehydroquinate dehydratase [Neobacillus mesonae]|uniref:type I 3-dehydroquinate dehydratase n=1 Tax=Neobacillus mesonae TaxID=1193713 RepID=UPI0025726536|nr:type I 3-dehydroquinate dehydratase [Neobacillus mesonae]MED4202531.1 type I 3-dehydroquinate dehydratase [Neobacillus mesonae]
MTRSITVRGVTIGQGTPKICVPMVGRTLTELLEEANRLKTIDLDVVEWRADFFEHVDNREKVIDALYQIRSVLKKTPLIFTFRSAKEGGEKEISPEYYLQLNKAIIETGQADIIDMELFSDESLLKSLVEWAHANNIFVIISNHDFEKTPSKEEIVARLKKAQELGGDLPKIAVMPQSQADVLTLLDATNIMYTQYANRPIITISMGSIGVISRLAGGTFGSALTFGSAGRESAPGQIAVSELRRVLNLLKN